jgi:hypothetical protein
VLPCKLSKNLHNPVYPDFDEIPMVLAPEEVDDTSLVLLKHIRFFGEFSHLRALSYLLDAKKMESMNLDAITPRSLQECPKTPKPDLP